MKKSLRQSNIELCRIIAIILVLIVHTTFRSIGDAVCSSYGMLLLMALSVVGVNVFVIITGYFSATPKKISLLQIIFVCLFWGVFKLLCYYLLNQPISYKNFFFITDSNWFIPSYICLLFIAPFLNRACDLLSKKQLLGGVLLLFAIRTWFDWIPPYPSMTLGNQAGHGVLSFILLYILARYVKLHGTPNFFRNNGGIIYLMMAIITSILAWVSVKMGHPALSILYSYNSPFVILSSLGLFMFFERKQFESSIINHFSKSVLSILLGHSAIFIWYTSQFKYLYFHYSGLLCVAYWVLSLMIVFFVCILFDQLRLVIWNKVSIYLKNHIRQNDIFESLNLQ